MTRSKKSCFKRNSQLKLSIFFAPKTGQNVNNTPLSYNC